jgi:hypothetical protein
LDSMATEEVVNFYDRFYTFSTCHLFAIMPFNAIVLKHCFESLCIPGLGTRCYAEMSQALMDFLPWLIPGTLSSHINATLAAVRCKTNNGYVYLWCILELTVPGFDPIIPILIPQWHKSEDIFHFAQSYLLYFRLQSKMHYHYTDCVRSSMFLWAIQNLDYADTITTLQSHVNLYHEDCETSFLPPHHVSTGSRRATTPMPKPVSETSSHHESAGLTTVIPWSRGNHRLTLIHHLSTILATWIVLNVMELASATTTAMVTAAATQGAYTNASGRAGMLPCIVLMHVPRLTDHAPCRAVLSPA